MLTTFCFYYLVWPSGLVQAASHGTFLFNSPLQLPLLHLPWTKVQTQKLALFLFNYPLCCFCLAKQPMLIWMVWVIIMCKSRELWRISKLLICTAFLGVQQIAHHPQASCVMTVNANSLTYSCNYDQLKMTYLCYNSSINLNYHVGSCASDFEI